MTWPSVPLVRLELLPTHGGYSVRYDQEEPAREQDDPTTGLVTFDFATEVVTVRRSDLDKLAKTSRIRWVSKLGSAVYMVRHFKP